MTAKPDSAGLSSEKKTVRDDSHIFSVCLIGFGFYWAWLWISSSSLVPNALIASRTSAELLVLNMISPGASAIILLLVALLFKRFSTNSGHRSLIIAAIICSLISVPLMSLVQADPPYDWFGYLAAIAAGVSRACFVLLWGKLYTEIGIKRASISLCGSITLGALLYLVITSMQPTEAVLCTIPLPLAAAISYNFAAKIHARQTLSTGFANAGKTISAQFSPLRFWHLFLGMGIFAIAFAFLLYTLFRSDNNQVFIAFRIALFGVAITGLLFSYFARNAHKLKFFVFSYRLILPITAIGFLMISLLGIEEGAISIIFVMIGFTVFDILTLLVLSNASDRLNFSPYQVFGYGRFIHFLGLFIGTVMVRFISDSGNLSAFFAPISLVMVLLLILASTLVLTENEFFSQGFFSFDEQSNLMGTDGKQSNEQKDVDKEQNRARWKARCEAVAKEYELSPREEEILMLLAKGRDTLYIQNKLVISNHTVRSHVYHLYQKLEVHSRQELLDIIEAHSK
jgi:DNA-binding CsgD family transcriptional regulator